MRLVVVHQRQGGDGLFRREAQACFVCCQVGVVAQGRAHGVDGSVVPDALGRRQARAEGRGPMSWPRYMVARVLPDAPKDVGITQGGGR